MLYLALLLLRFFQSGPTQVQDPNYPIRILIMERNVERHNVYTRMWGRADNGDAGEQDRHR
jgi:hypothetical protein